MAVNMSLVMAFKEAYSREELVVKLKAALEEVAAGVQVTQITFEGGGASGRQTIPPGELVEIYQAAIALHDDTDAGSRANSSYFDLSKRRWGT